MKSLISKTILGLVLIPAMMLSFSGQVLAHAPNVTVLVVPSDAAGSGMSGANVTWYDSCATNNTRSATTGPAGNYLYPTNGVTYWGSEAFFGGQDGDCGTPGGGFNCVGGNHTWVTSYPGYTCGDIGPTTISNNTDYVFITSCSPNPPPVQTPSLSATNSCSGSGQPQVNLSWTGTADKFVVYKNSSVLFPNNVSPVIDTGTGTYYNSTTANTLVPGNSYSYYIQAWNSGNGTPANSNTVNVPIAYCDTTPPTVSLSVPPPPGTTCLTPAGLGAGSAIASAQDPGSPASGVGSVTFNIYDGANPTSPVNSSPIPGALTNGTWQNTAAFPTASMITGHTYYVIANATDVAGNGPVRSVQIASFDYDANACVGAFLQTTGGDVHSNQNINTTGGPP